MRSQSRYSSPNGLYLDRSRPLPMKNAAYITQPPPPSTLPSYGELLLALRRIQYQHSISFHGVDHPHFIQTHGMGDGCVSRYCPTVVPRYEGNPRYCDPRYLGPSALHRSHPRFGYSNRNEMDQPSRRWHWVSP